MSWLPVPAPADPVDEPNPDATALESWASRAITQIAATMPRSLQAAVGFSELAGCERKLAYQVATTAAGNHPDPLASSIGTGFHSWLAEGFERLNSGRYRIEVPVQYRGVPGTADLVDLADPVTVVDWKTSKLRNIRTRRRVGPSKSQRVQIHGYGTALAAAGIPVKRVALVYIPVDGVLADVFAWSEPLNPALVDKAIDRLERISQLTPEQARPEPSPLCPWCPYYRNPATAGPAGCLGKDQVFEPGGP
jgi:hypothetical protein